MPSSGEENEPTAAAADKGNANGEAKHWLEYAIFIFVIITAIATSAAAWYTRQQWITAGDVEERQLRAYVTADSADISVTALKISATISIKNSGQTPAYEFREWSRAFTNDVKNPIDPPFKLNPLFSKTILGPQTAFFAKAELPIDPQNAVLMPALQNGAAIFYVVGGSEYADAFQRYWCLEFRVRAYRLTDSWALAGDSKGNSESPGRCQNWPKAE